MIRIDKERMTELKILSERYGKSRTHILNDLVKEEFQRFLGEYTDHDLIV